MTWRHFSKRKAFARLLAPVLWAAATVVCGGVPWQWKCREGSHSCILYGQTETLQPRERCPALPDDWDEITTENMLALTPAKCPVCEPLWTTDSMEHSMRLCSGVRCWALMFNKRGSNLSLWLFMLWICLYHSKTWGQLTMICHLPFRLSPSLGIFFLTERFFMLSGIWLLEHIFSCEFNCDLQRICQLELGPH